MKEVEGSTLSLVIMGYDILVIFIGRFICQFESFGSLSNQMVSVLVRLVFAAVGLVVLLGLSFIWIVRRNMTTDSKVLLTWNTWQVPSRYLPDSYANQMPGIELTLG